MKEEQEEGLSCGEVWSTYGEITMYPWALILHCVGRRVVSFVHMAARWRKGLVAEVLRFILQLYICRKDPPHQIFNITPTPHSLPMDHMFNWLWQIKHLRNTTISLTYQLCREEEWMHNSKRENISLKKVAQDVGEEINSQFIHRMDGDIIICP